MQKRLYMLFNFIAFNLLFFALYLNFIYKDASAALPTLTIPHTIEVTTPSIMEPAEPAIREKAQTRKTNKSTSALQKDGGALRLSMN